MMFFYDRKLETGEKVSLNKDNLLLRGCTIKNTDFVEGIVLYAGQSFTPIGDGLNLLIQSDENSFF